MSRKRFIALAGGVLAAAASSALPSDPKCARSRPAKRPNILMIVTDGERAHKGLPPALVLPARRRLAARGISFVNYQTNALACGPARSVIYTGQQILQTGVFDNPGGGPGRKDLDTARFPTLGHLLKRVGYHTVYKGKWHLGSVSPEPESGYYQALRAHGFDEWQQLPDYYGRGQEGHQLDPVFSNDAVRWLTEESSRVARHQPWLLCVNLINPHDVMFFDATGHQESSRLEPGSDDPMRPAVPGEPYDTQLGFEPPPSIDDSLGSKPRAHAAYKEHANLSYGEIAATDWDSWARYQNYYYNCLRDVDTEISRILDALRDSGEESQTVVVFTSDHGEMGGAHGMRTKGPVIYPEVLDVPFLVVHPQWQGGFDTKALAGAVDIVPTLLGLTGMDADTRAARFPFLRGQDLSPVIRDTRAIGPRDHLGNLLVYSAVHASNPQPYMMRVRKRRSSAAWKPEFPSDFIQWSTRSFYRGIHDGRYRFARYFAPNNHHAADSWEALLGGNDLELYDDLEDPQSLTNLAAEPERHRELMERLNRGVEILLRRELDAPDNGQHMPGPRALWSRQS